MSLQPATAATPSLPPAPTGGPDSRSPQVNGTAGPSGSPSPSPSRLPNKVRRWSRRTRLVVGIVAGLFLTGGGVAAFVVFGRGLRAEAYTGPTWIVRNEKLQLTIVERGA